MKTILHWLSLGSLLTGCGALVGEDFEDLKKQPPASSAGTSGAGSSGGGGLAGMNPGGASGSAGDPSEGGTGGAPATGAGTGGSAGFDGDGGTELCNDTSPLRHLTVKITNLLDGKTCSGTLLTNGWVLTANHCLAYETQSKHILVQRRLGSSNESSIVDELVRHPSSAQGLQRVDLALLRLTSPMSVAGSSTGHRTAILTKDSHYLNNELIHCMGYAQDSAASGTSLACHDTFSQVSSVEIDHQGAAVDPSTQSPVVYSEGDLAIWESSYGTDSSLQGGGCYYQNNQNVSTKNIDYLSVIYLGEHGDQKGGGRGVSLLSAGVREWIEETLFSEPSVIAEEVAGPPSLSAEWPQRLKLFWYSNPSKFKVMAHEQGWEKPAGNLPLADALKLSPEAPSSISWSPGRSDLFVTTTQGDLNHFWHAKGVWQGPAKIDLPVVGPAVVASWGENRLDLFMTLTDRKIHHIYTNNPIWSHEKKAILSPGEIYYPDGEIISPPDYGTPCAVGRIYKLADVTVYSIDVFALRPLDGKVVHKRTLNGAWLPAKEEGEWDLLPMTQPICSAGTSDCSRVTAVTSPEGWIDLFVRGPNGNLWHAYFVGEWTLTWLDTGIPIASDPVAASSRPGRIDLVWRDPADNTMRWMYFPR
ncbi:MAG: trypsin-like serine protease [Myxococcaceae bacterium]|nr:MAG: trypsin-like serine protease [Myxococcaceae bacterium]